MEKEEEATKQPSKEKKIRGGFPRIPLKKVLELTDAIFEEGQGDPVRRRDALEKINRSPDSSNSVILIQAANAGYALISGNKNSSHLELNEKSILISNPKTPNFTRISEIHDLLYGNIYFSAILNKYNDKQFPSDTIAIDFLAREHKLPQQEAEICWAVIKENIIDYNLFEDSSGKKIIIGKDYASSKITKSEIPSEKVKKEEIATEEKHIEKSQVHHIDENETGKNFVSSTKKIKNVPQITFNIQVVLPENATPATYESIFASMATHLLGREDD